MITFRCAAGSAKAADPELRSLLAVADERERALALVFLDTGLRLSELASLRVGDVRPDGTLHVMGKGAKSGSCRSDRPPVAGSSATSRPAVSSVRLTRCSTSRRRTALTACGVQQAIARLGRRSGVSTRCSPHTFRHTFARGYLVNGGDVFSLQQILGPPSPPKMASAIATPRA